MIQNILVVGGGSAGFLAAISLKIKHPKVVVKVVRSKEIGVIGVGEGTTFAFPLYVHGVLGLHPGDFHRMARPTWKLGLRFTHWGPRDHFDYTFRAQLMSRWEQLPKLNGYYVWDDFTYADVSPALMSHNKAFMRDQQGRMVLNTDAGYHIENHRFVDFLEAHAAKLGIVIEDDIVLDIRQDDRGVSRIVLKSGRTVSADLYVDCSGFASLLMGKTLKEPFISYSPTLFNDRAVTGGWKRTDEPIKPYTTCEAMEVGWCWQIDHEDIINRGYVHSSAFMSLDQAQAEFLAKNPKATDIRIVKFVTGRYERSWVKNVVAIGNACGFVEPLEATALGVICMESDALTQCLAECDLEPTPSMKKQYNSRIGQKWDSIRRFLGIHFKFNTAFDNDYWRACREKCDIGDASEIVEYYKENGPGGFNAATLLNRHDIFTLEGWWSLLVGQKVPYRQIYVPSEPEKQIWRQIQQHFKSRAMAAATIAESLAELRNPTFQWPPIYDPRRGMAMQV